MPPAVLSDQTFDDLLARVRTGAAERERRRELPAGLVRELAAAGFANAHVPRAAGGEGASLETLFDRLVRLARADANVAHVFRGHLAFVEKQYFEPDPAVRDRWWRRVLDGDLVGNAVSEASATSDLSTVLRESERGLRLDGRKFYTTGSIYADWIDTSAAFGDRSVQVFVPTRAPGVEVVDDWKGFGQRLTGSGTTTFTDVEVDPAHVRPIDPDDDAQTYLLGFFQNVLLAVVVGIGYAALDDTVEYVRGRRRIFGYAGEALPREHHLVQAEVGGLSSAASAARAVVLQAARTLDAALGSHLRGGDPEALAEAQLEVYRAQQVVLPLVVDATARLFEVGGASAVDVDLGLDRHWRNARTIATHNPAIHRRRAIGDFELNGTPTRRYLPAG
ncbi:acyl-CoA dehydrogenase family protein [Kineococcus aurantiacus]|uniref:Alkylation response protein AidB-like acyl-CoA dehydrogenase n=1 Tax=Kineococcus aurantiacus TaxID=37633 RepID=A0A7Y9DJN2_9ACTN|nr:alkylation response protein AidB-like acyl-CoA dehydrogenase [Kineococcus aurantiacus]